MSKISTPQQAIFCTATGCVSRHNTHATSLVHILMGSCLGLHAWFWIWKLAHNGVETTSHIKSLNHRYGLCTKKLYTFGVHVHREMHYYIIVTGNEVYTLWIIGHSEVCSAKQNWVPYQPKLNSYYLQFEEGGQRLKSGNEEQNFCPHMTNCLKYF